MQLQRTHSRAGFTMVEVLMALSISMFLLASAYATVFSLAKGSESMVNFSEMNTQSRTALELFGRDMRMANDVRQEDWNEQSIVIRQRLRDNTFRDVRYAFIPGAGSSKGHFRRELWSEYTPDDPDNFLIEERVLLYDVDWLNMNYYRYVRSETALSPLETKHIQLEAKLQRNVLGLSNTNYIISARFMMRNKDVTNQ
jgi:prepilin-type N-terminal cleavage/methylation domain-containing protein